MDIWNERWIHESDTGVIRCGEEQIALVMPTNRLHRGAVIAAAPDLLRVSRVTLAWLNEAFRSVYSPDFSDAGARMLADELREAIARAEVSHG